MAALPDRRWGPRSEHSKLVLALEPGEGFVKELALRGTISALCTFYGKRLGRVFETRKVGEEVYVRRVS